MGEGWIVKISVQHAARHRSLMCECCTCCSCTIACIYTSHCLPEHMSSSSAKLLFAWLFMVPLLAAVASADYLEACRMIQFPITLEADA